MGRQWLSNNLQDILSTLTELKRMHQLNYELLEQLNITCQWIVDNQIAIPNPDHLHSLLVKSLSLMAEIEADEPKILQYNISKRKVTDNYGNDGANGEVPVPFFIRLL